MKNQTESGNRIANPAKKSQDGLMNQIKLLNELSEKLDEYFASRLM